MLGELYQKFLASPTIKRRLLIAVLLIVFLGVLSWVSSHAFITITVENAKSGDLTYALANQGSHKSDKASSPSHTIKRLVHKGSYEILIEQGDANYFSVSRAGGFLTTSKLSVKLTNERARKFVGNNPLPCMYYSGLVLYSYNCNGSFNEARIHVPATLSTPTYIQKNPISTDGTIEGIAQTGEGTLILQQPTRKSDGSTASHHIFLLQEGLKLSPGRDLADLNPSKAYSVEPYIKGFIVYDAEFSHILYYSNLAATPSPITLDKITGEGYGPYAHSIQGDSVIVAYTNLEYEPRDGKTRKDKPQTKLALNQKGNLRQFTFAKTYGSFSLCGTSKLCLLRDKKLEVYDISGQKQKLLYAIDNILSIQNFGQRLLVARDNQLLDLDIDKRSGYSSYNFGDYTYCGLQTDTSGYTLCLVNNKKKRVALHLDQQTIDKDSIDKKIANLLKYNEVEDISVYDKFIYISPNVGTPIYNLATNGYGPDVVTLRKVNTILEQAITTVGINRSAYSIINPYQDLIPKEPPLIDTD